MKFFRVETALLEKGIAFDRFRHFVNRSRDNRYLKSKVAEDSCLDSLGQYRGRHLCGFENHIATLNVGLYLLKPQRCERRSELFHLNALVRAYVNSAKQGNVDWHGLRSFGFDLWVRTMN